MKIVVIGGHGRVGSKIVAKLIEHGHEAVAADLGTGVNTITGEGLAEALAGATWSSTCPTHLRAKVAQEHLIESSPIPYSIVRSTQFMEFVKSIADAATEGDTVRLPTAGIQPIAADDAARAVGMIAAGQPVNGIVEIAGPEPFRFDELIRQGLTALDDPRRVVADPDAEYFGTRLSNGSLLPGEHAQLGETRFEDWLSAT